MKNIYLLIAENYADSSGLILATVTGTTGSTPQKPGSSALFLDGRLIAGTVGGGIIEGRVTKYANNCSGGCGSALLHFSLDRETSEREEAVCGGTITILVDSDPLAHPEVFREMKLSLGSGQPGVMVTKVIPWNDTSVMIKRCWTTGTGEIPISCTSGADLLLEVRNILETGNRAGYKEIVAPVAGEKQPAMIYLEPVFPLPRLVIAGAGHIGKAVSHLGRLLEFEVMVIDDREEFANAENLPDADNIIVKDIGAAVNEISKDMNTFIVIVTRGHGHDADALRPCMGSKAAYVGMMGSRVKVAKMHEEFITKGWATEDQWKQIHTPIGLEIGSQTVEEIAVSIAAQLVMVRRIKN
ncbi:MAG: XdhC family protein [Bacteroidales bacterium]